jgi:hypothetical protein
VAQDEGPEFKPQYCKKKKKKTEALEKQGKVTFKSIKTRS